MYLFITIYLFIYVLFVTIYVINSELNYIGIGIGISSLNSWLLEYWLICLSVHHSLIESLTVNKWQ